MEGRLLLIYGPLVNLFFHKISYCFVFIVILVVAGTNGFFYFQEKGGDYEWRMNRI